MRRGNVAASFEMSDLQEDDLLLETCARPWDYDDDGEWIPTRDFSEYAPRLYHPDNERKAVMERVARTQRFAALALKRLEAGELKSEVCKWFMGLLPSDEFRRMQELSGANPISDSGAFSLELGSADLTNHFRWAERSRPVGRDYQGTHGDDVADYIDGIRAFTV